MTGLSLHISAQAEAINNPNTEWRKANMLTESKIVTKTDADSLKNICQPSAYGSNVDKRKFAKYK